MLKISSNIFFDVFRLVVRKQNGTQCEIKIEIYKNILTWKRGNYSILVALWHDCK